MKRNLIKMNDTILNFLFNIRDNTYNYVSYSLKKYFGFNIYTNDNIHNHKNKVYPSPLSTSIRFYLSLKKMIVHFYETIYDAITTLLMK